MNVANFILDKIPVPVAKVVTGASAGTAAALWLVDLELWARIVASFGAAFGGLCAGVYWLAKLRRENKYTDNESGL